MHEYSGISGDSDGCWALAFSINTRHILKVVGVSIDAFGIASPINESLSALVEVVLNNVVGISHLVFHFMHHVFLDFVSNLFHSVSSGSRGMFSLVSPLMSLMSVQMFATSLSGAMIT